MAYGVPSSTLRYQVSIALLVAGLTAVLPAASQAAEPPEKPIRALQRYPYLADFFAYGIWHPQAP
ncbi:MAG: hypothetical protein CMJ75_11475 [Planctomycetaceae bacterium]|nr:hypothetical protein [Planctomycetaceae bacterium]